MFSRFHCCCCFFAISNFQARKDCFHARNPLPSFLSLSLYRSRRRLHAKCDLFFFSPSLNYDSKLALAYYYMLYPFKNRVCDG